MWILTDNSSYQHVRKVEGTEYSFDLIEMSLINYDKDEYGVYADTVIVNVDDMYSEETSDLLTMFGYSGIDEVIAHYGRDAEQIVAECIFEHESSFKAPRLFVGGEEECIDFIKEHIKK